MVKSPLQITVHSTLIRLTPLQQEGLGQTLALFSPNVISKNNFPSCLATSLNLSFLSFISISSPSATSQSQGMLPPACCSHCPGKNSHSLRPIFIVLLPNIVAFMVGLPKEYIRRKICRQQRNRSTVAFMHCGSGM